MSSRQVQMAQLVCDGANCGALFEHIGRPVAHLRELAAQEGWRHRSVGYDRSNWARQVDLCPACPDGKELQPR